MMCVCNDVTVGPIRQKRVVTCTVIMLFKNNVIALGVGSFFKLCDVNL